MFKKFIPKYHYKSIYEIDYLKLKEQGIKVIMFDLDNTLIPYHEALPNNDLFKLKEQLQKVFKIMIVSNSKKERVERFAKAYDILYVKFAKKPFKSGFIRALDLMNIKDKETVLFVGDQLLTDIFGSNRMSFNSCLVDPINKDTEALITKMNRLLEKLIKNLTILFNKKAKTKFNNYEVSDD